MNANRRQRLVKASLVAAALLACIGACKWYGVIIFRGAILCVSSPARRSLSLANALVGSWHLTSEPGADEVFIEFREDGTVEYDWLDHDPPERKSGSYSLSGATLFLPGHGDEIAIHGDELWFNPQGEHGDVYRHVTCLP